jgi:hypothetical protein
MMLSDVELIQELGRRYPIMVFGGQDLQGNRLTRFQGDVIVTLGLASVIQQAAFRSFEEARAAAPIR